MAEAEYNNTWNSSCVPPKLLERNINSCVCVVCIFGLLGNGTVIWLLGFRMKRSPFTTYILNLAVADFGVLISSVFMLVLDITETYFAFGLFLPIVVSQFFFSVYSTSQFLLTLISLDRCVAVLFPLWYRCHRPIKLSTILCVLTWLLSFLIQGICLAFHLTSYINTFRPLFYAFLVNAVVCLPLITVSTLILFIRFCLKSKQYQRGKLLMAILLALIFFLICAFPLNVMYLIWFNARSSHKDIFNIYCYNLFGFAFLCASLNSFVNPLLYFLVGRKKRGLCRENLRLILRRVFMEEEEACGEEPGTPLSDRPKPPPQENV